jgi:hypothetical protein
MAESVKETSADGDVAGERARRWVDALDFESPARSAVSGAVRLAALGLSIYIMLSVLRTASAPLLVKNRVAPLNGDEYEDHRYGMKLATRKAIFDELAAIEVEERRRAIEQNTWVGPGNGPREVAWSREDDRGAREMEAARRIAKQKGLSLTQVYMVLDEAIREKWPGPDGQPLIATTPPLKPRSTW